jgi:polyhydroxyalkanoate synthesis regulator phasin
MSTPQEHDIDYLIELVATGEANQQEFDYLMEQVRNDPQVAEKFRQTALAATQLETEISAVEHDLAQIREKREQASQERIDEYTREREKGLDRDLEL